jgi:hypothetical protein
MDQLIQVMLAFGVWIAAAAIPLIPAVAIYKLFPDTKVAVSGPLSGLSLRASGAFGVYVVVFLLTSTLPYRVIALINADPSRVWNINFKQLDLVGANGRAIDDPDLIRQVQVVLDPAAFRLAAGGGFAKVAETDGRLPTVVFVVPGRGSKDVDLQSERDKADAKVNTDRREITLMSPISVRVSENKAPYAPSGESPKAEPAGSLAPP